MNDQTKISEESRRIKAKLDKMSKEQLLQELLRTKLANHDLTTRRQQDQVYIVHLESVIHDYTKGVENKIVRGISALQL